MAAVLLSSSAFFFFLTTIFLFSISSWEVEAHPVSTLINKKLYNNLFLHKDDTACPANDFYIYRSFIEATKYFPRFGTTGSLATRKLEIAAFLARVKKILG
ncbi:putative chitinase [Rosa chinensis]|uniref:Putative chitinase n=1 Tax=Rosa chinensis TaxID=74649 RepID=A0A2P6PD17_ROSCH|nr:putative chitinase [Rosa chinensis]